MSSNQPSPIDHLIRRCATGNNNDELARRGIVPKGVSVADIFRPADPDDTAHTGAVARGQKLYVATIDRDAGGRTRLIASRSGELELRGRDQDATQAFFAELYVFLLSRHIFRLTFAFSPSTGGHMACAEGYKIEALLQATGVEMHLVHATSLTSFGQRDDISVPGPDRRRLSAAEAGYQKRAILAAVRARHDANERVAA